MNALLEKYSIVLSQDIHWGDMDAFNHVNNIIYFRYFEDARIAYFNKMGMHEHKKKTNVGPILANTECNFKLPMSYPDKIFIGGRGKILSPKKFQMDYMVFSESLNGVAAEGKGLLVYYDYNAAKSCEIPEHIVNAINNEKDKFD